MSDPAAPIVTASGLPATVPAAARLYLRPVGLAAGSEAEAILVGGTARRLAGGPFAFAACQVYVREPGRIRTGVAPLAEIESWAERLPERAGGRVHGLLDRLTGERSGATFAPGGRPVLMGVINATPDSFSDGGEHLDPDAAASHGKALIASGAGILDVGGESTRPGAAPVDPAVERDRVMPVLERLRPAVRDSGALLSLDSRHAEVMKPALAAGAAVLNDVTALTGDPDSLPVAAGSDATVVLMHMQGEPETMNVAPRYEHAALDVFDFLEERIAACVNAGIDRHRLIVDPGIGFGKSGEHNLRIMRALTLYHGTGCPVLIGASRKGLTGAFDREHAPRERLPGSLAAAIRALDQGVQILRVHDVAETRQAVDVWESLVGLAGTR